jgi:predicted DNA-binding transcriptional regulator AlpA
LDPIPKPAHKVEQQSAIEDRLLRASDVQRELGISRATAYRMMTDGTLPVYRFPGQQGGRNMVRVSYRDLREWREAHKARTLEPRLTVLGARQ